MSSDQARLDQLLQRKKKILAARDDLISFAEYINPLSDDPDNVAKSAYQAKRHHRVIAAGLEKVEEGAIKRLIINVPPRHGKTALAAHTFVPWYMGKHPEDHIILASYSEKFAWDFGRKVREILHDPLYRHVFPHIQVKSGAASVDRVELESGGRAFFVGRGGTITGRGGHCFPAGTMVLTEDGEKPIEELELSATPRYIIAYDTGKKRFIRQKVKAFSRRRAVGLRRITTASGRVVTATADHPFYVEGRWIEAGLLTPGDRLLCAVREGGGPSGMRCHQARKARADALLLLRQVFLRAQERAALWGTSLHELRSACAEGGVWIRNKILFDILQRAGSGGAEGEDARESSEAHLLGMQHGLHAYLSVGPEFWHREVLFEGLCQPGTFQTHVKPRQSEMEGRGNTAAATAAFCKSISNYAKTYFAAGQSHLRRLLGDKIPARSSYRQLANEQRGFESGDTVRGVSSEVAWSTGIHAEPDIVALVEQVCEETDVYDIEVEGTHNFFANGILVHNCLIIDDPIKDRQEADSKTLRDKLWTWYTQVLSSRLMGKSGRIVLVQTRWSDDDLPGRLTDPANHFYNEREAAKWHLVDLPALAEDNDVLGRKSGEALWPERFDVNFLEDQKRLDPRGFMALYQGRPAPDDGILFRAEMLSEYNSPRSRPADEELRFYCSSDHAVSTAQDRDRSCLLAFGVDKNDEIWIMPDSVWARLPTDRAVEAMCNLIRKYKPIFWFAETGHITKSIGPFLRKRMMETKSYAAIDEITPIGDKVSRAQSVIARMSSGKVHFPTFAPWWPEVRSEILKFPAAAHDDFVDAMSMMGLGLMKQMRPRAKAPVESSIKFGTGAWLHDMKQREKRAAETERSRAGW